MKKLEEEFNYLIELSGKVLTGQIEAEEFETHRAIFLNEYGKKQQPEIPEFVAKVIEERGVPEDGVTKDYSIGSYNFGKVSEWIEKHQRSWLLALLNGYTVAKEKRFYLKNKLTGLYLRSYTGISMNDTTLRFEEVSDNRACGFGGGTQFTQQEIDSMETGSYEKIEVEE